MGRYADAAQKAADLTNQQLAVDLASLGPLNDSRLNSLLPTKREKEEFAKLMALVEDEAKRDKQMAYLAEHLQVVGPVVLKVLKHFV